MFWKNSISKLKRRDSYNVMRISRIFNASKLASKLLIQKFLFQASGILPCVQENTFDGLF